MIILFIAVPLKSEIILWYIWNLVSYRVFSFKRISSLIFVLPKIGQHMHKNKFVFSQLIVFLDRNKFNYIVHKHDSDKYVKHFTCWSFDVRTTLQSWKSERLDCRSWCSPFQILSSGNGAVSSNSVEERKTGTWKFTQLYIIKVSPTKILVEII